MGDQVGWLQSREGVDGVAFVADWHWQGHVLLWCTPAKTRIALPCYKLTLAWRFLFAVPAFRRKITTKQSLGDAPCSRKTRCLTPSSCQ